MMTSEAIQTELRDSGVCVVPGVLTEHQAKDALNRLWNASRESERRGISTRMEMLDPNDRNVRVFHLPEYDPLFVDLLLHPTALAIVQAVLGGNFIISNFTANIALPGSGSMKLHSDQALVVPPPWQQPWALNIIWCLTDVNERNGATRYVPGSHHYRTFEDLPSNAEQRTRAFEAPAGSIVAMEGRVWHTSGCNMTNDEERAMLFGYYTMDFIRQQVNWEVTLSASTKASLSDEARQRLGLGPLANARIGANLVRLQPSTG